MKEFVSRLKFSAFISPLIWELLPAIILANGEYTFRLQIGFLRFFVEISYVKKNNF
jgi:hypothetical protein